jgi:hypothetical protein
VSPCGDDQMMHMMTTASLESMNCLNHGDLRDLQQCLGKLLHCPLLCKHTQVSAHAHTNTHTCTRVHDTEFPGMQTGNRITFDSREQIQYLGGRKNVRQRCSFPALRAPGRRHLDYHTWRNVPLMPVCMRIWRRSSSAAGLLP